MVPEVTSLAVSIGWCLFAIWLGPKIGFVDDPEESPELKAHRRPAPPLGGVGVFAGIHVAAAVGGDLDYRLLAATTIVLLLGMVDDRLGLSPPLRLVVEVVAAAVLIPPPSGAGEMAFYVVAVLLVVLAINAVNLFDGLDGLAAPVAIVSAGGLAVIAGGGGLPIYLAAALAGFLVFNWHPARIFLGDAGAYVVGLTLTYLIIESSDGLAHLAVLAAVLGVYLLDLAATLVRRWRTGRSLLLGDRSHLYDQMRQRGWSVPKVALVAALAQAAVVTLVVAVERWLPVWAALLCLTAVGLVALLLLAALGFLGGRAVGVGSGD